MANIPSRTMSKREAALMVEGLEHEETRREQKQRVQAEMGTVSVFSRAFQEEKKQIAAAIAARPVLAPTIASLLRDGTLDRILMGQMDPKQIMAKGEKKLPPGIEC